ncbi:MAG: glycoside hydrolase family 32 protein [Ruminococcaceae bacterium]|nr:glycoside hydrolase family 32 protein [Oscillospiraceae bacterium]
MKNVSKAKFLTLILTIVMLIGIIALVVSANDNVSESTTDTVYVNELPGLNGDYYDKLSNGYRLDKVSGNNLALSTLNSKYFTFESDVTFVEGTNTSFIFGAKSSDWSDTISNKKAFFGLCFMKSGTTIKMKMYQEYGLWSGIIPEATVMTDIQNSTIKLKISYKEDNKLRVYINGEELSFSFGTKAGYTEADFVSCYQGGYFGLMSYNSTVKYENITLAVPQGNYVNSLPGVDNINGYSVLSDKTGYEMNYFAGNNILVSGAKTKHFTLEADVNIKQGSSGALVFGAQDKKCASIGKFFGLEFKKSTTKVYIKLFQDGGGLGDNVIPGNTYHAEIENATDAFHIRVNYDENDKLNIFVNEQKIEYSFGTAANKTEKDFLNAYNGGYIGFLTYKANVEFDKVKLYDTDYIEYNNDIPNLQGKDLTSLTEGYVVKNNGNDNFVISDVNSREFEYNLTAKILSGDRFSLIFGSETNDATVLSNLSKTFLAIEFRKATDGIYTKMFRKGLNYSDTYITSTHISDNNTGTFNVSFGFSEKDGFSLSVDGNAIDLSKLYAQSKDPVADYLGGYFGILTFKSKVSFSGIKLTTKKGESPFKTNLTSLYPINGTWKTTDNGLYSEGSGDNFALSETVASDFIYEADVTFADGATGAASLVFRSTDTPNKGSYVANIDKNQGNIRIFAFPGGTTIGSAKLTEDKASYHLKVEAIGKSLKLYVDGMLVICKEDTAYASGKLGLLTFNSKITYQNVEYTEITSSNLPALNDLKISADGVKLYPDFTSQSYSYSIMLPRDVIKYDLCTSFSDGIKATYKLIQDQTKVTEGILTSDTAVEITPPFGMSRMIIDLTRENISTSYMIEITNRSSSSALATENYRPQIHFSPEINFMNDPNGLVYDTSNNTWHMFFQYSPQLDKMGSQTWGHAVSDDLVNWVELPVAIPITDRGAVFSGSAVSLNAEEARKTPFFTENDIAKAATGEGSLLVALYTTVRPSQDQSVAYSTDHGVTWTQYPEYAIQHEYTSDRDPKVFKIEGDDRWYLIVAGGYARLYVSENLADWTLVQDLTWSDGTLVNSECPDMYPLAVVDRNGNKTGETKWVYSASSEWYIIGDMVWNDTVGAYNYVAGTKLTSQMAGSSNAYAAQSYYNDPNGRRIMVHWIQDYSTTNGIPKRWNGIQSLPLETTLIKLNDGTYAISQNPVSEVLALRGSKLYEKYGFTVSESDDNILVGVASQIYEIILTVDINKTTANEFGFELRQNGYEKAMLRYDAVSHTMIMDKSGAPTTYQNDILSATLLPDSNGKIKLRLLIDNSVLEFFGNDGEAHLIDLYYASTDAVGMSFYSKSGDVFVDSLEIYELKSIYTGKDVSESAKETYASIAPVGQKLVGSEFTVTATVYPMKNFGNLVWNIPNGLTVVSENGNSITLIGNVGGIYTVSAEVAGTLIETTVKLVTAIETTPYGEIDNISYPASLYPLVIFGSDKSFIGAYNEWGAAMNAIVAAGKENDYMVYLRNDVSCTTASDLNGLRGSILVDLNGYTLTLSNESGAKGYIVDAYINNNSGTGTDVRASWTFKNGTMIDRKTALFCINYGNSLKRNTEINFTFDNITFIAKAKTGNVLFQTWENGFGNATAKTFSVTTNAVFNNCTFDYKSSVDETLMFDLTCGSGDVNVFKITINGGQFVAKDSTSINSFIKLNENTNGRADTLVFGKNSIGEYMRLVLPIDSIAPKTSIKENLSGEEYALVNTDGSFLTFVKSTSGTETDSYILSCHTLLEFKPQSSITLGSELVYNVYVPVIDSLKSYTINGVACENAEIVVLDDGNSYYHISISLPVSEAIKNIVLKVIIMIDGKDYTGTFTMSIPKYAKKVFDANNSDTEVLLVKDVLAYIRAAYVYFESEDKDNAVNIIDGILGDYKNAFEKVSGVTNTANGLKGVIIALEEKPIVRFILPEGKTAEAYTFKCGSRTLEYTTGIYTEDRKNYVYVQVELYAYQLISDISYTDGTYSGSYHINSYYDFVTTDEELKTDVNLTTLVEKLYNYCKSAENYRASVSSK